MPSFSEPAHDGGGGGDVPHLARPQFPHPRDYTYTKLRDGTLVPTYTRQDDEDDFLLGSDRFSCRDHDYSRVKRRHRSGGAQSSLKTSMEILKEYYSCPICYDPCIEATVTNCGHMFCRECLEEWIAFKPVCPICSKPIRSQHRLYHNDLFVESLMGHLPQEIRDRYVKAQEMRMKVLHQKGSLLSRLNRKVGNCLDYVRSKRVSSVGLKMKNRVFRAASSATFSTLDACRSLGFGWGMLIGLLLALLIVYVGYSNAQFLRYMWLATVNYDGTIPNQWLQKNESPAVPPVADKAKGPSQEQSYFEWTLVSLGKGCFGLFGYVYS